MALTGENLTTNKGEAKKRQRLSKDFRREQLINSTIDSLAKRGFSATTLGDVAEGAGLSRGIVNFHFESKEKLLLETLRYISETYTNHWKQALDAVADQAAAKQLQTMIRADLDKKVCNSKLIPVWFGFWAEAQSRPAYQKLAWERDEEYLTILRRLCTELKNDGGYDFSAHDTGSAIYAMQEGLWLRLTLGRKKFKRERALEIMLSSLNTLFPAHFDQSGELK